MAIVARSEEPPLTFFSLGHHHDFAVLAIGDDGPAAPENAPGLFHVAFGVGDTIEELIEARDHLVSNGVEIEMTADHTVSKSIYFSDPDGNMVEFYVEASDVWHTDPQRVADFIPMTL